MNLFTYHVALYTSFAADASAWSNGGMYAINL